MALHIATEYGDTMIHGTIENTQEMHLVSQTLGISITGTQVKKGGWMLLHLPPRTDGIEIVLSLEIGSYVDITVPDMSMEQFRREQAETTDAQL